MDDPWGSPWTTEQKPPSPVKGGIGLGLEPPPRAFLSTSSSPRLPAIASPSPWADDGDGFNDWAAPDAAASTIQSSWGGGWGGSESDKSPHFTPVQKADVFGKGTPIALPDSIALPKQANGSAFRQTSPMPSPLPSLDPWSSEFSLNVPSIDDDLPTPRLASGNPISTTHSEKPTDRVRDDLEPAWGESSASTSQHNEWAQPEWSKAEPDEVAPRESAVVQSVEDKEPQGFEQGEGVSGGDRAEVISEEVGSRPSSLSGDESDHESSHEVDQQYSPITSIDEDSKISARMQRKASGKVQELVEKFDGIARSASEEPPPLIKRERARSRGQSPFPPAADDNEPDEGADFGDFEDAKLDDEDEESEAPVGPAGASSSDGTPAPEEPSDHVSQPSESRGSSTVAQNLVSKYGDIKFEFKAEDIEKFFDREKVRDIELARPDDADVSDRILQDSFTEISERKTWYRVSRQGSSRKHDGGDDENYRRVAWPTANIRLETIKIVRRWMEEDSITGRIVLGTGTKSSMFGWDSSAEPVSLDKVFGKKAKSHSRAASLQQPPRPSLSNPGPQAAIPLARKASGTPKSPTQRQPSLGMSPIASFGWSTATAEAEPPAAKPVTRPPQVSAPTLEPRASLPKEPTRPALPAVQPVPTPVNTSKQAVVTGQDDDDDWGEMVSSPHTATSTGDNIQNLDIFSSSPISLPPSSSTARLPSSSAPADLVASPVASNSALASNSDPWGSVDFSIFDAPTTNPSKASAVQSGQRTNILPLSMDNNNFTPIHSPTHQKFPPTAAPRRKVTFDAILSPPADKTFTPTTPIEIVSPLPVSAVSPATPQPPMGDPEDEAVRTLLRNLPDLSYMLR